MGTTARVVAVLVGAVALVLLASCSRAWNNPYPDADPVSNTMYRAFSESPRHLDPARSYTTDEAVFTAQIYEPPLQYHYLLRPYTLVPLTATEIPRPALFAADGTRLGENPPPGSTAYSVWTIHIRPGIRYQPHPAFARDADGKPLYMHLDADDLSGIHSPSEFPVQGTRELVAADYVYEIKRLADPRVNSPIFSVMADHIEGFSDFADRVRALMKERQAQDETGTFLDLRDVPMAGVQAIDRYTFQVRIRGRYPQFRYWLAMPFFAPMAHEVDRFYAQPVLAAHNMTLDQFPVGTGPYMLTTNVPNRRMVLEKNPNFHGETYPARGEPGDRAAGLLADAGKPLPFIQRIVFSLESESIPYWNKFLQGYYDESGISSDSFDQVIQIGAGGEAHLTASMKERGFKLMTAVIPGLYYMGFNMLDPVVGGETPSARKLRRAISIAVDYKEFISIFLNGRGIVAQGPIPPDIFGHLSGRDGLNKYLFEWEHGRAERRSLAEARRLLAEAGYPNGIDRATGDPLLLYLDMPAAGAGNAARLNWFRKQFEKLNIQLVIRSTTWSRFQEKLASGNVQIFGGSGWIADYPDPENFLFLLYGPNGAARHHGANSANYANPEFDRLFERMRDMKDGPERAAVIRRMVDIARRDAPWVWGFYPKSFGLRQGWVYNAKPNTMANNTLKYLRLDPQLRAQKRAEWNDPTLWPLPLVGAFVLLAIAPAAWAWRQRERRNARGRER